MAAEWPAFSLDTALVEGLVPLVVDAVRPSDLRGLMSFAADYPEAEPLLLYRGDRALQKGPVRCIPVEEFLLALGPDRPLT